jgi:excinuclease ABC subunit C
MSELPEIPQPTWPEALRLKLENLPTASGVYQYKDKDGKIIYVGKAKNLRSRVRSYFQTNAQHSGKTKALVAKITDLELIQTDSEIEALILENTLIKKLKPRYNINLKDDKTYPYIVITNEPFPRVFPTRRVIQDGSKYFGPYTDVRQMRLLLDAIRNIFQVRSCSLNLTPENIAAKKFKVCLDYHIKKCKGPCEALQTEAEYDPMIADIKKLLNGRTKDVAERLQTLMMQQAKAMKFEDAAETRNQIQALDLYSQKQKVLTTDDIDRDIFAVASEDDDACGVVFKVRSGKLIGTSHVYLSNVEEQDTAEVLQKFLEKYYLEADFVPSEIFIAALPADAEAITELLQRRLTEFGESKKVEFIVPQIGDKAKLVKMCEANAKFLLGELKLQKMKKSEGLAIPASVRSLERDLRLPKLPRRIECFDNSNFQGTDPVASMVCFVDGKAKKSDYRKFKIKTVVGSNDFASMAEIMERRYAGSLSQELPLPELIVIDGGKGQLSAAYDVLKRLGVTEKVTVIGLAKKLEEVFFPNEQFAHNLPKTSSSLKLLQNVRDEAHRFAITFHRELRTKRTIQTELTEIKGLGKIKAEKLLKHFGSIAQVREAALDVLTQQVGSKAAQTVRKYFDQQQNLNEQNQQPQSPPQDESYDSSSQAPPETA